MVIIWDWFLLSLETLPKICSICPSHYSLYKHSVLPHFIFTTSLCSKRHETFHPRLGLCSQQITKPDANSSSRVLLLPVLPQPTPSPTARPQPSPLPPASTHLYPLTPPDQFQQKLLPSHLVSNISILREYDVNSTWFWISSDMIFVL